MNLHHIVSGSIQAVNPRIKLGIQVSTGYATRPDGNRIPSYAPMVFRWGDVQALQYNDLMQIESLNIQGEKRKVYINGEVDGLVRVERKGGDLITNYKYIDGVWQPRFVWLTTLVLEYWPDWCCFAVTLQDDLT